MYKIYIYIFCLDLFIHLKFPYKIKFHKVRKYHDYITTIMSEEKNLMSLEALNRRFGCPKQIAHNYLLLQSKEERKKFKQEKIIKTTILCILSIIAIMICIITFQKKSTPEIEILPPTVTELR